MPNVSRQRALVNFCPSHKSYSFLLGVPLRKNHMKKPTCESRVKLEQHFTCDPHVVKTHVIHM